MYIVTKSFQYSKNISIFATKLQFFNIIIDMIFYHGTSEENWNAIQKEGILYGRRFVTDSKGNIVKEVDRCTYLAVDVE